MQTTKVSTFEVKVWGWSNWTKYYKTGKRMDRVLTASQTLLLELRAVPRWSQGVTVAALDVPLHLSPDHPPQCSLVPPAHSQRHVTLLHTLTQIPHTLMYSHTDPCTHTHTHKYCHTLMCSNMLICTLSHAHIHWYTLTSWYTDTHRYTHSHTLSPLPARPAGPWSDSLWAAQPLSWCPSSYQLSHSPPENHTPDSPAHPPDSKITGNRNCVFPYPLSTVPGLQWENVC